MSNDSERKEGLDLGLSALLQDPAASCREPAPAPPESSHASSVHHQAAVVPNEFETLAAASRWKELVALCEERMTDNAQGLVEPRLWWVTGQLRSGQLPVTLLVAPLEAATRQVATSTQDPRVRSLAACTLAEAASAAKAAGDGELQLSLLHKASELDSQYDVALAHTVDAEVSRLKSLTGLSTTQLLDRDRRVSSLQSLRPAAGASPEERVLAAARARASSRSVPSKSHSAPNVSASISVSRRYFSLRLAGVAVAIAALAVLALCATRQTVFTSVEEGILFARADAVALRPELKLAEIPKVETVSAFDGLYYDLKNETGGRGSKARLSRSSSAARGATASTAAGSKQMLVIDGPSEPPEMQNALLQPDKAPEDSTAATLFGGADTSAVEAQSVIAAGREGGATQPFVGHRIFKVLVRTKIMAHPQYQTDALGVLNAGDRVSAEGQVDSWLQIRSTSGRIGFVLSQDVEPEAS